MTKIQRALKKAHKTVTWEQMGRELGVTAVYVSQLARGKRALRLYNPLHAKILDLYG